MATNEKNMKTWGQCCNEVAKKYELGTTLVTGHREKYWTEAAELYREEGIKEELKANNEAHKSATRTLVKEAVKLARGQQIHKRTSGNFINKNPFYTESEILEKLKL